MGSKLELIEQIHNSPVQAILAVTGGGSRAISDLLTVPGASRTVLEAVVPYAASAMTAWIGARPEQFCSSRTGRLMAMAAFQRAGLFSEPRNGEEPFHDLAGIGCTASLASDRPKHGPHRIHVALQTAERTVADWLELGKGHRTRDEEESVAAALVLNLLAESCGMDALLELDLRPDEQVVRDEVIAPQSWRDLLLGKVDAVCHNCAVQPKPVRRVIFPGTFNPLHDGHRGMAAVAAEMLGQPVEFEISIVNVDKPMLDYVEMARRSAQFSSEQVLWFTRAAKFTEKVALFENAVFVVGADTIVRIADPRYYDNDAGERDQAIHQIAAAGGRFLVFGRKTEAGFQGLDSLQLPAALRELCQGVPAERFRQDISSTELRTASRRIAD